MAQLGTNYFTTIPEATSSKRVECILYNGPNLGTRPNEIRKQDNGSLIVLKLLSMLEKHEKRILKLE